MGRVAIAPRPPLQGGLPPAADVGGLVVEIACDESGFSGSNLLDPATPVFTHASTDLSILEATALVEALRTDARWSLDELKSGHLIRGPHADGALTWLLSRLEGRAHVEVVDKEYFLATRVVDLLLSEPSWAAGTRLTAHQRPAALALYLGSRAVSPQWPDFLAAFVDLVRTKRRHHVDRRVIEAFFRAKDDLAPRADPEARAVLGGLTRTRVRSVVTRLVNDDRTIPPPLEPLLTALAETVLTWGDGGQRVLVVHDEQSALTADRLRRLQKALSDGTDEGGQDGVSPLAGLVTVDSRDDARVQVADLLAGVARRWPALGEEGPLHPFLSPTSLRVP
jgi:hypothetical protein